MKENFLRPIDKIISGTIALLVFSIPLFFLPITSDFYFTNKNFLLLLLVAFLLFLWALKVCFSKELKLKRTSFDLPILIFGLVFILASFLVSPKGAAPFLVPGETGTILALVLLYFILVNNLTPSASEHFLLSLTASATLLSLIAIWQFMGLGATLTQIDWLKSKAWTPAGGSLPLIAFLLIVLPQTLISFSKKIKSHPLSAAIFGLITLLIGSALVITLVQVLAGKETRVLILPYADSWAIGIESFKQAPVFGIGPGNFISAFNRFRTFSFNRHDFWNIRFTSSSSYPLHLLTTIGCLGLIVFVWLTVGFIKYIKLLKSNTHFASFLVAFSLLLFLPANLLTLFTFFVLLALWVPKKQDLVINLKQKLNLLPLLIIIPLGVAFYFGGRAYAGELYYKKSLDSLAQNKGTDTYNNQIRTIAFSPYIVTYRIAYSQTNFALANALASKNDLTDQEKSNISQLIQQAIREAKIATSLNPKDAAAWENLAQLYRKLINFAQGADQWAIAGYQQTLLNDPLNPRLRIDLGGLYYSLGNYEAAARNFQDAINLKPDLANAYYNLAATYREEKKYPEAYQAMQQTLNLIPTNTADWQKAKKELDELATKIPSAQITPATRPTTKPEEALSQPQTLPSPALSPSLKLPEETNPESNP